MQLYVYAMAAERALGQSPTELVLYFLRPGVEHVFAWNDEVRREAVQTVSEAFATVQGSEFGGPSVDDLTESELNPEP
jgi:hypothetical protein